MIVAAAHEYEKRVYTGIAAVHKGVYIIITAAQEYKASVCICHINPQTRGECHCGSLGELP